MTKSVTLKTVVILISVLSIFLLTMLIFDWGESTNSTESIAARAISTDNRTRTTEKLAESETSSAIGITNSLDISKMPDSATLDLEHRLFFENDFNNPESVVSKFLSLSLRQYNTPEDAEDAIDYYLNNRKSNAYMVSQIASLCKHNNLPTTLDDLKYRDTAFNTALKPRCKYLTKNHDPFWTVLELARNGDEYMQLISTDIFKQAVRRYTIQYFSDPLEYMNLRDEVFGYLETISAKGVSYAANKLYREYANKSEPSFLPRSKLLAYYYGSLAIMLGDPNIKQHQIDKLERYLTTKEIERVNQRIDAMR